MTVHVCEGACIGNNGFVYLYTFFGGGDGFRAFITVPKSKCQKVIMDYCIEFYISNCIIPRYFLVCPLSLLEKFYIFSVIIQIRQYFYVCNSYIALLNIAKFLGEF